MNVTGAMRGALRAGTFLVWGIAVGCGGDDASAAPDAGMQQASGCATGAICRGAEPKIEDLDRAGPYATATFTLPATADSGGATVYHPTDAAAPFAYAVFCPPYQYGQSHFAAWGPFFASHGIVLATMDAADPNDYPPRRARGLEQMVVALRAEHTRVDSPLRGKLDEARGGVLGWSMGGGAALTVTGAHPEWKSAVLITPNTATSSGYGASANATTVPTLIVNGALDNTVLGGLNQSESAYAALPASTPKLFYLHANLGHFDWGTPGAGGAIAGRYVMAWEKTYLEGDVRYAAFLKTPGPNATKWESNL